MQEKVISVWRTLDSRLASKETQGSTMPLTYASFDILEGNIAIGDVNVNICSDSDILYVAQLLSYGAKLETATRSSMATHRPDVLRSWFTNRTADDDVTQTEVIQSRRRQILLNILTARWYGLTKKETLDLHVLCTSFGSSVV